METNLSTIYENLINFIFLHLIIHTFTNFWNAKYSTYMIYWQDYKMRMNCYGSEVLFILLTRKSKDENWYGPFK